jgi:hypothetical protein
MYTLYEEKCYNSQSGSNVSVELAMEFQSFIISLYLSLHSFSLLFVNYSNLWQTSVYPLALKLSAQCTMWKTWDSSGCPLLFMFLASDFIRRSVFSASYCTSTVVSFQHQRVKQRQYVCLIWSILHGLFPDVWPDFMNMNTTYYPWTSLNFVCSYIRPLYLLVLHWPS